MKRSEALERYEHRLTLEVAHRVDAMEHELDGDYERAMESLDKAIRSRAMADDIKKEALGC